MTEDPHKNNRVSTREYFAELQKLRAEQKADFKEVRKDQADMERRIVAKIDCIGDEFATKKDVENLEEGVADLRKRNRITDVALSIGIIFSTTIGAIFGRE